MRKVTYLFVVLMIGVIVSGCISQPTPETITQTMTTTATETITSRKPQTGIVEGLEELALFIHPEAFGYSFQPVACEATG